MLTMSLRFDDPRKGFVIFAADCTVCDEDGRLHVQAEEELRSHAANFYALVSSCEGCWGPEFLFDGSQSATPLFYVVDPYGDCLSSLLSRKESEQALVFKDPVDALSCPRLVENRRVFACIGFIFEEQFIELEDFNREVNGDEEPMDNLPTLSHELGEGIEVYLKQPEEMGDSSKVLYCAWLEGEVEEDEVFDFEMSETLSNILR